MLSKRGSYKGYVLFESILALTLVSVILLQLVPLIIFVETKKQENRKKLEMYRYATELARSYHYNESVEFGDKQSYGQVISADGFFTEGDLTKIMLEMEGEVVEIELLSREHE